MFYGPTFFSFPKLLAPVVRKVYNAIQRIAIGFPNTYPLDSDLSGGLGTGWFSPNWPELDNVFDAGSVQSWTKVLGTVLQYSYFSVFSRLPLKTVHPFRNFVAVLSPSTLHKVETRKNSGYTRSTLFVRWGEELDMCKLENPPEM